MYWCVPESGGWEVQGHSYLQSQFKASIDWLPESLSQHSPHPWPQRVPLLQKRVGISINGC